RWASGPSNARKSRSKAQPPEYACATDKSGAPGDVPRIVDNHTSHFYGVNVIASEFPVLAVLCGSAPPPDIAAIEKAAVVRYTDAAGLPEALTGAEALFVYDFLSTAVPGAWDSAGDLQWLHIASAGVDPVLFPGLVDSDVVLTNS